MLADCAQYLPLGPLSIQDLDRKWAGRPGLGQVDPESRKGQAKAIGTSRLSAGWREGAVLDSLP